MLPLNDPAYDWEALSRAAHTIQVWRADEALTWTAVLHLATSRVSRTQLQLILTDDEAASFGSQVSLIAAANLAGVGVSGRAVEGQTSTVAAVLTKYKLPMLSGQP
jgi:hypothetical protein